MPAKSRAQRIAVAIAEHSPGKLYERNKGLLDMTKSQQHDFAATPEKGLPAKAPTRKEPVPGLMATRQALRGMRADSIRHIKKPKSR